MAVQSFKGLGWFLCGAIVAPACYLVNSHGAAEQARLNAAKLAIVQAQRDIRQLETEFNTRANMAQLERWNGEVLALAAPAPQQYLASETGLAALDQPAQAGAEVQVAALIIPTGAAPVQPVAAAVAPAAGPVQKASVGSGAAKSAGVQDGELRKLMKKVDRQAVAMVGDGVLSASTMDELKQLAKREKLALR